MNNCVYSYIVFNLSLSWKSTDINWYHAGSIIIEKNNKLTIERFEPHGKNSNDTIESYDHDKLDNYLKSEFDKKFSNKNLEYISANELCPFTGPQAFVTLPLCNVWSTLYLFLRLVNPTVDREQIIAYGLMKFGNFEESDKIVNGFLQWSIEYIKNNIPKYKIDKLTKILRYIVDYFDTKLKNNDDLIIIQIYRHALMAK